MKTLYDGEIYGIQKVGGINRYFDNIISRLPPDFEPILTSARSRNNANSFFDIIKLFTRKNYFAISNFCSKSISRKLCGISCWDAKRNY